MARTRVAPEIRFEKNVERTATCWLWKGALYLGYGRIKVGRSQTFMAHRWSYEHFVGPIPEGKQLDHLCRVRHCVNPAHLEPVTIAENVLRGEGPFAQNARKTHCKHGHPIDGTQKSGRECRTCRRAIGARHDLKRRAPSANL